jgi:hypothetical protein
MTSNSSLVHLKEDKWQIHNVGSSVKSNISSREDYESLVNCGLDIVEGYRKCKKLVINAGFKAEIEWQSTVNIEQLTESTFLREHAWVTLSSGMKEKVVRTVFQKFSQIFYNWKSAEMITKNEDLCRETAFEIFANNKKIDAILQTSRIISTYGFEVIKKSIMETPEKILMEFPYIGPITYFHLAKNIGVHVAKPDRHLSRLVKELNISSVQTLCSYIGERTGDTIPVVDIVLWRYATITEDFVIKFILLSK